MKKISFYILVMFAIMQTSRLTAQWQEIDGNFAFGGYISCMTVNGNNIYVGTSAGGVFLSPDNGTTWNNLNVPSNGGYIHAIVVSGSNIFVGGNNILNSKDNGVTWTTIDQGISNGYLTLAINGNTLYAGTTSNGLWQTNMYTINWTQFTGLNVATINSIAFSGNYIFAGTENGAYWSNNNGGTWTLGAGMTLNNYALSVNGFTVSGSNIFAATEGGGVFLSTNNGVSWTPVNNGIGQAYILNIVSSGSNIFAGSAGAGVYQSSNNGASWFNNLSGLLQTDIISSAVSGCTVYVGTYPGGVFTSSLSSLTGVAPAKPGSIAGNASVCKNSAQTYSVAAVPNANTYTWTVPPDATINSGQGTNVINLTWGITPFTLSVNASNCNGTSASVTKAVSLSFPTSISAITGNASVCKNSTQTYSVAAVTNATTYTWTVPPDATNIIGQGTNTITLTWGITPFTLSVYASNCNGSTATVTKAVTIPAPFALESIITGNSAVCKGSTQTFSVPALLSSVPGSTTTYNWSVPPDATVNSGLGTNVINLTWGNTPFTLNVTANNCNGASNTAIKAVTVPGPFALASVITGNSTVCPGSTQTYSVPALTNSVPGSTTTYNWSLPPDATNIIGQGTNIITLTWGAKPYTLSVIASNCNGKTAAATKAVTLPAPSALQTVISGNSIICQGSTQTYFVTALPNSVPGNTTTYNWTVPPDATNISGQGTNEINLTWGTTTPYTLKVSATNCNGTTAAAIKSVTLPVSSHPNSIIGTTSVCPGSVQTYSVPAVINTVAGGTITYNWSVPANSTNLNGQGTNSITLTWGTTPYTLSVVANNCNGSSAAITKPITIAKCAKDELPNELVLSDELPLSVNNLKETDFNIEVYPNPNNGQFNLLMTNNDLNNENVKIQILNMIGQVVYSEIVSFQMAGSTVKKDLQLINLPTGNYFLQVLTSKELFNKKLIIIK